MNAKGSVVSSLVPIGAAVQHEDYYVTPKDHKSGLIDVHRNLDFARQLKLNYLFWSSSPKEGFQKFLVLLNSPGISNDTAGGLSAAVPACYRPSASKQPKPSRRQ